MTRRCGQIAARAGTSSAVIGFGLAVYGLLTHYVDAMRARVPFRVAGWFDVKAQLGNVFYTALHNTAEFFPNLLRGRWSEAMGNLTNMAGIRSTVYTQVMHAGATNNAEAYVLWAPGVLVGLGALGLLIRTRADQSLLSYVACIGMASATFTSLLLNVVYYYQGVAGGVAGFIGYLGSGVAKAIDMVITVGAGIIKEVTWHLFFLLTDGKEKTIGWLTHSRPAEDLTHYLAQFPSGKINDALHTALFQALVASAVLLLAHHLQARQLAAQPTAVPKRRPAPKKRLLQRTAGRRKRRPLKPKRAAGTPRGK